MKSMKPTIQFSAILLWCLCIVPLKASAWSGELSGYVNEQYIVGAGSLSLRHGLSLLGTIRLNDHQRAVFQVKIAASELEPKQGHLPERIILSEVSALEQRISLSYQIYNSDGQLLFNAVAHNGHLDFSQFDQVSVEVSLVAELQNQGEYVELSSQNLKLNNAHPETTDDDLSNNDSSSGSLAINLDPTDTSDPFDDAHYEDDGCDFWDGSDDYDDIAGTDYPYYADENESHYDSFYSDEYDSDESISCDSNDSIEDDYESDDGCTDDEWAAEAKSMQVRAQSRNRQSLKRWRALNRLLPLLVSILMIAIWRTVIRFFNSD